MFAKLDFMDLALKNNPFHTDNFADPNRSRKNFPKIQRILSNQCPFIFLKLNNEVPFDLNEKGP